MIVILSLHELLSVYSGKDFGAPFSVHIPVELTCTQPHTGL